MSKIEELRKITEEVREKKNADWESIRVKFFNGKLFERILSDFEEEALLVAQKGEHIAFIRMDTYFPRGVIPDNGESLLDYAMTRTGYFYSSDKTNDGGRTLGFSW